MQDKITIALTIDADFKTLQAIREHLNLMPNKDVLIHTVEKLFTKNLSDIEGKFNLSVSQFKSPKRQRTSKGKRQPIPRLMDDTLYKYNQETKEFDIVIGKIGSYEFVNFLDWEAKSFSYRSQAGLKFTAVKRGSVWYAVKQLAGNKQRRYLGDHNNFTHRKLHDMAFKLAQRKLEPIRDTRQANLKGV